MVIIYPSRSTEQSKIRPYRNLLNSDQVNRIYLDELGNIRELPLEVAVMLLTTVSEEQAPGEARYLLQRTQQENPQPSSQAIIELITTIIAYKFNHCVGEVPSLKASGVQLSRREVEEMLGITFEETQFYRDIKQEEAQSLVFRLLTRRVGELSSEVRETVENLSLEQLENLGEALLDFNSMGDLQAWLDGNG